MSFDKRTSDLNAGYKFRAKPENREKQREHAHEYRLENYDKVQARIKKHQKSPKGKAGAVLRQAVSRGRIEKPIECSECEIEETLHGHHEDYTKPLDVIWLCVPCHGKRHRAIKESNHE